MADGTDASLSAEDWKVRGNEAFKDADWDQAVDFYSKAIELDHPKKYICYSNRSAANLKRGSTTSAVADANCAISENSKYWKGYSRLGGALQERKEWDDAEAAYTDGLAAIQASDPGHTNLSRELAKCKQRRVQRGGGRGGNATASSSGANSVNQNIWKQGAHFLRMFIVSNALLYCVPVSGFSETCWKYVLMGCVAKYVLALSYHGRPALNAEYGIKVLRDLSSHYLFLTFILFLARPVLIAFFPLVVPDIYILAGEFSSTSPGLAKTMGGIIKPVSKVLYGTDVYSQLQPAILEFNASVEIALAVLFTFELLTPYRNLLCCLILWQFVRTRYMLGDDMKRAWSRLHGALNQYIGGVPVLGPLLRMGVRFASWMTKMPEPGQQPSSSCTVS